MNKSLLQTAAVALILLILPTSASMRAEAVVTIDPSIRYGTWQGWGTSLAWWAKVVGGFPEPSRSDYMTKGFDPVQGLGLNIVRYNIGGGENPLYQAPNKESLSFRAAVPGYEPSRGVWDWNADANQRWVLKSAIQHGANQLEAFSNSPPWWQTVSGSVGGGHNASDNLRPDADTDFADYLTQVVQYFHESWGGDFPGHRAAQLTGCLLVVLWRQRQQAGGLSYRSRASERRRQGRHCIPRSPRHGVCADDRFR